MSSYWAATSGTGLALNQAEFDAFIEKYKAMRPFGAANIENALDDGLLAEAYFIPSNFNGEPDEKTLEDIGFTLSQVDDSWASGATLWPFYRPDGTMNQYDPEDPDRDVDDVKLIDGSDACYVCWSAKNMCGPGAFVEKPYASYADFVQEFKNLFQTYLPEDFDWDAHLGFISFASYA